MGSYRLDIGGRIDRSVPVAMQFDGTRLSGYEGDTLASALLAADIKLVGRSFKYHRPRGIMASGVEDSNALVNLGGGERAEPNSLATITEAHEGLEARTQNAWPSVTFDVGAVNNLLSPVFSAGFYYKTFVGPFSGTGFWMFCERFIRKAAGMGKAPKAPDPDTYEKINGFCDVLVVGAGPAGLSAALTAGRDGLDVVLVEQDYELGGQLLSEPVGSPADQWRTSVIGELEALPNVRILRRTSAFGAYDHGTFGLVERLKPTPVTATEKPRQRFWLFRAAKCILATGTLERPLVFGNNDIPGVMLAGSIRTYLNRYAVSCGRSVVIVTNNNSVYQTAIELALAGVSVTICEIRSAIAKPLETALRAAGVHLRLATGVLKAEGRKRISSLQIAEVDHSGRAIGPIEHISCDCLGMSGGFVPVVHLWSQRNGKPTFDEGSHSFVPGEDTADMICAGSMSAVQGTKAVIRNGVDAVLSAFPGKLRDMPDNESGLEIEDGLGEDWTAQMAPIWCVSQSDGETVGKAFVDFQHDVKRSDIDLAHQEGYLSVEHLKRYTTSGMASDQGKTSNLNAMARMAELRRMDLPEVGTTTFRPPYTPVSFGVLTGHNHGQHFRPTRRTPLHHVHERSGAVMTEAGAWMRPWYYSDHGEGVTSAYIFEAGHVRNHVGMVDVSTLGKIAIQGPDAAEFLNRVYVNGWKTLAVGRLRYGVMLREDGIVMDDGATARLDENDYFMSTTTANAAKVLAFAEQLLQTSWKNLKVHVTSVTDQWSAIAVAGPNTRNLLASVTTDADLSAEALPNNHFTLGKIAGVDIRIHRMSYSGELAYELYVPSGFAGKVWSALESAGPEFNLRPYGTEAMGALRIEKGHVAGPEIDGRTTLKDLGLEGFASKKKPFIGSILKNRPQLCAKDRPVLVGLEISGKSGASAGSLIYPRTGDAKGPEDGWVSSVTYSPALGKHLALALIKNGKERTGETVRVVNFVGGETQVAKIVSHHFFDPTGERLNA